MKTATEIYGYKPFCALCFVEVPSNAYDKRGGGENCHHCGNDFLGGRWYSNPVPKHIADLIQGAIKTSPDKDIDLRDFEIHECSRCQFSEQLGFCPKCDTQSCYP